MKKKPRKIPTPQSLANIALHYLSRYAASEASLRRVLQNRLRRAAVDNTDFAADRARQADLHSAIETIIAGHKRSGVLDDAAFAAVKVASLRRQGRSRRAITQKLALKGIRGETARDAFVQHEDGMEPEEAELKAAIALARRRKWGPFRKGATDDARRRKDFAAMARAGFGMDVIRKVLGGDIPEDDAYM